MAILSPVKKLFIPNKNMPAFNPYRYGTDMRAIENYVNNLAAPAPAGAYASLTGPGETATPGDLTQEGGFFVFDTVPDGIFLFSTGGSGGQVQIGAADSTFTNFSSIVTSSDLITMETTSGGSVMQQSMGEGGWEVDIPSLPGAIKVEDAGGGAANLGFYGHAAIGQQATPSTLADVILILQQLGLCS